MTDLKDRPIVATLPPTEAPSPLQIAPATREFLRWVAAQPRTYAETMAAWRSHCPRLTAWEDALADGLVTVLPGEGGMDSGRVVVTELGRGVS